MYIVPATLCLTGIAGAIAHRAVSSPKPILQTQLAQRSMPTPESSEATTGGLFVLSEEGERQVFPLKHTDVDAKIAGNLSRVEVTQTFENPFNEPLEAIYVFPLPDEAAVDDMEIKIGDRIIKGDIKRREEAREIYEQARREGRTAGLLEQERANIFTQSLANIKPGEQIDVTIRYTDSLKFEGGDYEFVFPMVVGPRYIPGNPIDESGDTDRVPDASQITPPVLKPGTRSGHDINVTVEIDAGVSIGQVRSPSHKLELVGDRNDETIRVSLAPNDTIPNKDFILRYRVSNRNTRATVLTQADDRGGHFALYLIPAIDYNRSEIVPKDVVFLMDTSGSQRGEPLAKSKELMRRFVRGLNPDDTFTIIDFANATQQLSSTPLANTRSNRDRAMNYIDRLDARGGTELLNGIQTVLSFPEPESGRLRSIVLLTDGYIGNEAEVIAEVQRQLKSGNRLYSFGVGSSVNRFLLDRLAEVGRGLGRVIRQDEPTQEVAETFFRRINNPVLTDIEVRWEGNGESPQIYPLAPPDLFDAQPLVLFGRQPDARDGKLVVTGTLAGGDRYEKTFDIDFNRQTGNVAIAQLWGRAKIKDLMNQMYGGETTEGVEAVTQTALNYRLLSKYTAFVAVTEEVRVDPDGQTRRVEVPVELPEGVSYEGIFGDQAEVADTVPASGAPRVMSGDSIFTPPERGKPGNLTGAGTRGGEPDLQRIRRGEPQAPIEIIDSQGLDANAIADLTRHLQQLSIPSNVSGELVFEFPVRNNRIVRVMLDEGDSTLSNETLIQEIRRSLLSWTPPSSVAGTVRVTLRIN